MIKETVVIGTVLLGLIFHGMEGRLAAQEPVRQITTSIGLLQCRSGLTRWSSIATLAMDRRTIVGVGHYAAIDGGKRTSAMRSNNCEFVLYDKSGKASFKSDVILMAQGGQAVDRRFSRATDWAVFHLTKPAPVEFSPIELGRKQRVQDGAPVSLFGMDRRSGGPRLLRRTCAPSPQASGAAVLHYDCDTGRGWSGAPILQTRDGHLQIIGVHSGRERAFGIAVIFTDPIRQRLLKNSAYLARAHRPGSAAARQ